MLGYILRQTPTPIASGHKGRIKSFAVMQQVPGVGLTLAVIPLTTRGRGGMCY